jgi:hypothetical protein
MIRKSDDDHSAPNQRMKNSEPAAVPPSASSKRSASDDPNKEPTANMMTEYHLHHIGACVFYSQRRVVPIAIGKYIKCGQSCDIPTGDNHRNTCDFYKI